MGVPASRRPSVPISFSPSLALRVTSRTRSLSCLRRKQDERAGSLAFGFALSKGSQPHDLRRYARHLASRRSPPVARESKGPSAQCSASALKPAAAERRGRLIDGAAGIGARPPLVGGQNSQLETLSLA
uniref:Uncharacterized protein n=1 Tax=Trichuris muris TaxID=70415 RepID=A0A5S6QL88_TRIMR